MGEGWGDFSLYFGCRRANLDNIYEKEIEPLVADGVINKFYLALSREPDIPKRFEMWSQSNDGTKTFISKSHLPNEKGIYVQDILRTNGFEAFRQIVEEDGHIYVCGDVSMASQVNTALEEIIQKYGNKSVEEARNYVLKLRELNHYHEDIYGVTLRTGEVTGKMRMESLRAQGLLKAVSRFNKGFGSYAGITFG